MNEKVYEYIYIYVHILKYLILWSRMPFEKPVVAQLFKILPTFQVIGRLISM